MENIIYAIELIAIAVCSLISIECFRIVIVGIDEILGGKD